MSSASVPSASKSKPVKQGPWIEFAKVGVTLLIATGLIYTFHDVRSRADHRARAKLNAKSKTYFAPPKEIIYFTFGYQESIADSLWIRYIQDFDLCEQKDPTADVTPPLSLDQIGQGQQKIERPPSACASGWAYQMLDRITDLAPRFRIAYATGAPALSILVDDRVGAGLLFEKAIRQYPNDWPILYRAAYHALFEEGDLKKSSDLLVRAARAGAPSWLLSLASRVAERDGQRELAQTVLREFLEQTDTEEARQRILERLKALESDVK